MAKQLDKAGGLGAVIEFPDSLGANRPYITS